MARQERKPGRNILIVLLILAGAYFLLPPVRNFVDGLFRQGGAVQGGGSGSTRASGGSAGGGYRISFPDDFKPGLASVDDIGLSVVLAVDVSGSMMDPPAASTDGNGAKGARKCDQAAAVISNTLASLQKTMAKKSMKDVPLKLAIITFNDRVSTLMPLTLMDEAGFRKALAAISAPDALAPAGKTAIGKALETATSILMQSGTLMKSAIVVSDGENTAGIDPAEVIGAINDNRNSANQDGGAIVAGTRGILVSFVGFDVQSGIFQPLESQGARVTTAADSAALEAALDETLVADISKLEAAQ